MVYQHGLFLIYLNSFLVVFLVRGNTTHAVALGFIQNLHSYRGNFHAERIWPREIMMRCCDFDACGYISLTSVAPREKEL